jgi:hypothetical protein
MFYIVLMFCLDYMHAAAFFVHYTVASRCSESTQCHLLFTFTCGGFAGATTAIALYPFDIVRMTNNCCPGKPGMSHFAFSTIPFMSAYLGLYFLQPLSERRQKPLKTKVGWALGATSAAAV